MNDITNNQENKEKAINSKDINTLTKSEISDYIKGLNKKITVLENKNQELDSLNKELSNFNKETLFESLINNIPSILYRCANDDNWTMEFISGEVETISGYSVYEFLSNKVRTYASIIHDDDSEMVDNIVQKSLSAKQPFTLEYRIVHKDGSIKWVYEKGQGVFDNNGGLLYLDGVISDITEKKKADKIISSSLKQKEVLLKEIHHRVKNNLQIISSIINLQKNKLSDPNAIKVFEDSQERIQAMSLIHQKLYQGNNTEAVNFKEYLSDLINFHSILSPTTKCHLFCPELSLGLETAVPLGLISSEIVTNAFKHAFDNNCDIENNNLLEVIFSKKENGKNSLKIIDNGKGLPENFDIENANTLGLQIVNSLIEQIDASISYLSTEKGTEFNIIFSDQ